MNETFYICVGAQRSATTWIYRSLSELDSVSLPEEKEIDFFRYLGNYQKGFDWYIDKFKGVTKKLDITPEYAVSEESIKLIHDNLGENVKILFILRNPVDRLVSAYQKHMRNGELQCDFDFFIKYNIDNCVGRSLYFPVIKRIEEFYSPTVLVYEDIKNNPQKWLDGVNEFLDVNIPLSQSRSKYNPSAGLSGFRGFLNKIYRIMPAWTGLRTLKEWLERNPLGNRFLYGDKQEPVNYHATVLANEGVMRLFRDDMKKMSGYLRRDLLDLWQIDC
jgi:hypothetical protein